MMIAGLTAIGAPTRALSCTAICLNGPSTPAESFKNVSVVLVGTVQEEDRGKWATVRVDELYKGTVAKIVLLDSGGGADCRMRLAPGKQYLLFLKQEKNVAHLVTQYICEPSGETDSERVAAALRWVRKKKQRKPEEVAAP